ncbi:MAG: hypothetical protein ABIE84_00230 [bacterium]
MTALNQVSANSTTSSAGKVAKRLGAYLKANRETAKTAEEITSWHQSTFNEEVERAVLVKAISRLARTKQVVVFTANDVLSVQHYDQLAHIEGEAASLAEVLGKVSDDNLSLIGIQSLVEEHGKRLVYDYTLMFSVGDATRGDYSEKRFDARTTTQFGHISLTRGELFWQASEHGARDLFSANHKEHEVLAALDKFNQVVALAFNRLIKLREAELPVIWNKEMASLTVGEGGEGHYHKDAVVTIYGRLQNRRREVYDRPEAQLASLRGKVVADDVSLVEACIGERLTQDEMEAHVWRVKTYIAEWLDGVKVGFASSLGVGFVNEKGRKESATVLWATMVEPTVQRQGYMVSLNFALMDQARRVAMTKLTGAFSWFKMPFVKAPGIVRTQSRNVETAVRKYFRMIDPQSERGQALLKKVQEDLRWGLYGDIQVNAYTNIRVGSEEELISGLDRKSAKILLFDYTLLNSWRMWFATAVIYPIKTTWKSVRINLNSLLGGH